MASPSVEVNEAAGGLSPVRHRRFTVAEYHKMIEAGILGEDEHVELLEGEIVQMSPQGAPHMRALVTLNRFFARGLSEEYEVRPQGPLTLPDSEPEPDLAIVPVRDRVRGQHPVTALLAVEVADSSVRYDLKIKSRLYAKASVLEYWLVVVPKRVVEVMTEPDAQAGVYRSRRTFGEADSLAASFAPDLRLAVRDLFD